MKDRSELKAEPGTKAVSIIHSCEHGWGVLAPQSGYLGPCIMELNILQLDTEGELTQDHGFK